MINDPRAPLAFGGLAILALGAYLYVFSPMPGALAEPHGQLGRFSSLGDCAECHAAEGLAAGCLGCHTEIAEQARTEGGYHGAVLRGGAVTCTPCHGEHYGSSFPLISSLSWEEGSPEVFDHGHVVFGLSGRHDEIACGDCHEKKRSGPFVLEGFPGFPRARTYLGLTQSCDRCHEDIHAGGLSGACDACHDQKRFRPASLFDHSAHFPLVGPHTDAPCQGCHVLPEGAEALPFANVRGKLCRECHDTPHRAPFGDLCENCHPGAAPAWSAGIAGITADVHALAGFPLVVPHDTVGCEKCHEPDRPFPERYRDPGAPGYDRLPELCGSCHGDPHEGQFAGRYGGCLDCHEKTRFAPSRFDLTRHEMVFALAGKHAPLECAVCHPKETDDAPRRFAGVPRECSGCHADPHDGQFAPQYPGCSACHDEEGFVPAGFDLARHAEVFPVVGAHVAVPCVGCHEKGEAIPVRRFVGTASSCRGCHRDPHGGQFEHELGSGDCSTCHGDAAHAFAIRPFDHAKRTPYALTGAHLRADCLDCHRRVTPDVGEPWVRYRGTSPECASCHRDEHRGQFREKDGGVLCDRCHASDASWERIRFDHAVDARFPLDGTHAEIPCGGCHPRVVDAKGVTFTQYKPLGTNCEDCHAILPPEDR